MDPPLAKQLCDIQSLANIPSIVLGDVEDGGHVEASSEAVENKSLEEPWRVMRES